jgi:phosphoglycolate phosphatase
MLIGEIWVNRIITLLDRLNLVGFAFRWEDRLRKLSGTKPAQEFVTVPGTPEMLHTLARRYQLALVTSRGREDAALFVTQYGLQDLFAAVVTRDDVRHLKPNPEPVLLAAKKLGVSPSQCVMVGDTSVDLRAAKAAEALTVGVLCGFGEEHDFEESDLILSSTAQLRTWL